MACNWPERGDIGRNDEGVHPGWPDGPRPTGDGGSQEIDGGSIL